MSSDYHRVLVLFVDGVGLAAASSSNPFSYLATPALERLLGGALTLESAQSRPGLVLAPIDARLGMPGLPQSATGQAALFTGVNGAEILGRHQTGLPGPQMRRLIEERSLFRRAKEAGLAVTFANAYSAAYLGALERGEKRPSATTAAMLAAAIELRDIEDLRQGSAVTWDLCRDLAGRRAGFEIEPIEADEAGRHLAAITSEHDLTLFETFMTDLAGHQKRGIDPAEAVQRLDAAIGGLEEGRPDDLTWILTSDHGNLEDLSVGTHTTNPVPWLVVGPLADRLGTVESILDVAPALLEVLGVSI